MSVCLGWGNLVHKQCHLPWLGQLGASVVRLPWLGQIGALEGPVALVGTNSALAGATCRGWGNLGLIRPRLHWLGQLGAHLAWYTHLFGVVTISKNI